MTATSARSGTWHTVVPTVLGDLTLVRDSGGLRGVYFPHHWHQPDPATLGPRVDEGFEVVIEQLTEFLAGTRREFDLPLVPVGDACQRSVWDLIARIPYGDTTTYGELATRLDGNLTAQQVGQAVGRNPLSIVVPCHRVVGSNGKLTGYAGGIPRKLWLLELEQAQPPALFAAV
jgi:methylated-DNA-[protein]-cysteine S-methyltransferase